MRKLLVVTLLVFIMALSIGFVITEQAQAKTRCSYECSCNGVVLYCCRTGPIVSCKIVLNAPIECTQQAGC